MGEGQLAKRIGELAAHLHAGTAEMCRLVAEFDKSEAWAGSGIKSCAHWLSINCGYDVWTAAELIRVGHSLPEMPQLRTAFQEGRLSFDKMRAVSKVATAEDEHIWLEIALETSGGQLSRVCTAFQRATAVEGEDLSSKQQSERRVRYWWREDGMLDLFATLPPEEGQVVLAAIEAGAAKRKEKEGYQALDTFGARRADALTEICRRWLEGDEKGNAPRPRHQLVVHVDVETLTGQAEGGRCHLENGPGISPELMRKLGCDADIVAITEKNGLPIDVGRTKRLFTPKQRRAIAVRDGTCRFPGCGVPATECTPHHIEYWADGGPTVIGNGISQCDYHHGRHHEGAFRIRKVGPGEVIFETMEGEALGQTLLKRVDPKTGGYPHLRQRAQATGLNIAAETARAAAGGGRLELGYAVEVIAAASARTRAAPRAGP
jgi:hypothetical protein